MSWDKKFMGLANYIAKWSKDPSTKVGAVIVNSDKRVVSLGYNGFPQGVDDSVVERYERPAKYKYTEHSERNAIFSAARLGVSLVGCTIYCNYLPCADCARAIIQSGIVKVVYEKDATNSGSADPETLEMFNEAGITCMRL